MSTKPAMSEQPKTIELPAMTDRALLEDLARSTARIEAKADNLESKVDNVELNMSLLKDDGRDTKSRLIRLEGWKESIEDRVTRNSTRAREPSTHDLDTKAALAAEITARESLAKDVVGVKADLAAVKTETVLQTAMLATLTDKASKFFANPIVRSIATIIGTAILTWLAAHQGQHP